MRTEVASDSGAPRTPPCGHAAIRQLDSCTATVHGRARIELRRAAVDAPSSRWCTRFADCDAEQRAACKMHSGGRACAHRTPMTFLHACGPAVAAGSTLALHGRMGACEAQALAVRLPRLLLVGAASHEHVLHVRTPAAWSESIAETCGSAGSTLGSRCMSAVNSNCAP